MLTSSSSSANASVLALDASSCGEFEPKSNASSHSKSAFAGVLGLRCGCFRCRPAVDVVAEAEEVDVLCAPVALLLPVVKRCAKNSCTSTMPAQETMKTTHKKERQQASSRGEEDGEQYGNVREGKGFDAKSAHTHTRRHTGRHRKTQTQTQTGTQTQTHTHTVKEARAHKPSSAIKSLLFMTAVRRLMSSARVSSDVAPLRRLSWRRASNASDLGGEGHACEAVGC